MIVAADEQLHGLFTLAAGAGPAAGAATGGLKLTHRHPFEVPGFGEQHHRALVRDQVDVVEPAGKIEDFRAPLDRVAIAQLGELLLDKPEHPLPPAENVFVVGDLGDEIFVFEANLVGLQCREPSQLHLQDGIGLNLAETMALLQLLACRCGVGGCPNQGDDRIKLIKGEQQAQQDVVAFLGLAQQVAGAPLDRLNPELEEHLEHLAQGEQDRLAIHQRQHVGAEVALQGRELEQVVQHHLGVGVPTQLHHDAHAIAIALIADVGDAFEFLVVDHLGDALDQRRLVRLIRQLGDDHRIAIRTPRSLDRLDRRHPPHRHRATAREVGLLDAAAPEDLTAGGKVGPRNDPHQGVVIKLRVLDQGQQPIDQLAQVVRRDVGGHAHGDAGRAIEQQLGDPGGQHGRLLLGTVEVVGEINRFRLDVFQQAVGGKSLQPRFGVSHRRRRIVVDRAEIAVPIDQGHRHREALGHAHQSVVDSGVAMGVVLTQHFTHHTGAFAVRPVAGEPQLIHGIKDAPMHRLEAIAGVGQSPPDDHAHRVLQIGARHLIA